MVKIKVKGAKVKVVNSNHPGACNFIGKVGTIQAITPSLAFLVKFPSGASWFYLNKDVVLV